MKSKINQYLKDLGEISELLNKRSNIDDDCNEYNEPLLRGRAFELTKALYGEKSSVDNLQEIKNDMESTDDSYQRYFLEGRALEITRDLDDHPEWWEYSCFCQLCQSYG